MAQESDFTTDPFAVRQEEELKPRQKIEKEGKEFLQDVKEQGKGFLSEQKGKAAGICEDMANAFHSAARQLEDQEHPTAARYLNEAARGLERFSGSLRQRDVDEITYKIRDFARRQPVLVLTGTLIAGFYLARLMKSGSEHPGRTEEASAVPSGMPGETRVPGELPIH